MTRRGTQLSARALDDLTAIGDFIAQDNPARARSFVHELVARAKRIADQPRAAPLRPEIGENVRVVVTGAYLILYTHRDNGTVLVERVVHGARDLEGLDE